MPHRNILLSDLARTAFEQAIKVFECIGEGWTSL